MTNLCLTVQTQVPKIVFLRRSRFWENKSTFTNRQAFHENYYVKCECIEFFYLFWTKIDENYQKSLQTPTDSSRFWLRFVSVGLWLPMPYFSHISAKKGLF